MVAFLGRWGRRNSPLAFACIIFLVADMTRGPCGVRTSLFNFTSFFTILMVAPESAHASSLLSSLNTENWLAVATGMDGDVVVVIPLCERLLISLWEGTVIQARLVLLWLFRKEGGGYVLTGTILDWLVSILLSSFLPPLQGVTNPHHRAAFVCHPFIWLV